MLVARDLRAVPLTVHIPFKDVPAALSTGIDRLPGPCCGQ